MLINSLDFFKFSLCKHFCLILNLWFQNYSYLFFLSQMDLKMFKFIYSSFVAKCYSFLCHLKQDKSFMKQRYICAPTCPTNS